MEPIAACRRRSNVPESLRRGRLRQRPRHLDAGRRRDRARRRASSGRQCRRPHMHVVDEVLRRPPSRRRWCGRGDLLDPCHARRHRAPDHQSRQSFGRDADRSGPPSLQEAPGRYRALQFFRVRRNECLVGIPTPAGVSPEKGAGDRGMACPARPVLHRRLTGVRPLAIFAVNLVRLGPAGLLPRPTRDGVDTGHLIELCRWTRW